MDASDILVSEFSRYYTADELPAFSAPDSDAILHNWAENSVHRLARRAQGHLGELVVLIDELIRDRTHPLFSEINDATNMEWNVEDTDWRVVKGLLTHMRTGLAEIASVSEPSAREALLGSYRAYQLNPSSGAARAARQNRVVVMLAGSVLCALGCLLLGTELVAPTPPDRNSGVPFGVFCLLLGGLVFSLRRFRREPGVVSDDLRYFIRLRAERVVAALARHREVPVYTRPLRDVRIISCLAALLSAGFLMVMEFGHQASHLPGARWQRLPIESLIVVVLYELCFRRWRGDAFWLNAARVRIDKPGAASVALTALKEVAVQEALIRARGIVAGCAITLTLTDQKGQSLAVTGDFPVYFPRGRAVAPRHSQLDGADLVSWLWQHKLPEQGVSVASDFLPGNV